MPQGSTGWPVRPTRSLSGPASCRVSWPSGSRWPRCGCCPVRCWPAACSPTPTPRRLAFLRRPAISASSPWWRWSGRLAPSSPFKLEMPGTWFFGVPRRPARPPTSFLLLGLVAVYGGLVLLMRVWYGLIKALARRPGVPIRYLWLILALWTLPMLVVAPIFSRDVFSYAAQGEMMSHHINPYVYGPGTLGAGPYVNPVDPLWIEHAGPLRPAVPHGRRLLRQRQPPPRAGHRDPPAAAGRWPGWPSSPGASPSWPAPTAATPARSSPWPCSTPWCILTLVGAAPQRRHHDRPAAGRDHRGQVQAPGVGGGAVRPGGGHQGAGRPRRPLHRLGLAGRRHALAPAGPAAGHRRADRRGGHGGLLTVVSGLGLGLDRQPGDPGHRPQLAGPGHRHRAWLASGLAHAGRARRLAQRRCSR